MSLQALRVEELAERTGEEIAVSPWLEVSQQRIDLFAEAIEDPQWIHIDPVRAKDGPFGVTIAHGFLTLSLLTRLIETTFSMRSNFASEKRARMREPEGSGAVKRTLLRP